LASPFGQIGARDLTKGCHHTIGSGGAQERGIPETGHADGEHASGPGRRNAGWAIFKYDTVAWWKRELGRRQQEDGGVRFAPRQVATAEIDFEVVIIALAFFDEEATAMGQPSLLIFSTS